MSAAWMSRLSNAALAQMVAALNLAGDPEDQDDEEIRASARIVLDDRIGQEDAAREIEEAYRRMV